MKIIILLINLLIVNLCNSQTPKDLEKKSDSKQQGNQNNSVGTIYKISGNIDNDLELPSGEHGIEVEDPNQIYNSAGVEVIPTYNGGLEQLDIDFKKKFKLETKENIKGKIFIDFVVEKNGSLSDIKIIRDIGFGTGNEALRVFKLLKKWKPGKQNDRVIRVRYYKSFLIDVKANE
jgi:periplasmic protein TonB